ncbi:MAG: hypothetical protein HY286_13200 [Planctomycetes bacterium]|nr:hypothetical protein [Planctomycetota bacterium]
MARSSRDLLSLLLQRAQARESSANPEADARPASSPEPQMSDLDTRPSAPRSIVRARASASKPNEPTVRKSSPTPAVSAPRVYVPSGSKDPITLDQIAASAIPGNPRSHSGTISELTIMRGILYPVLLLLFVGACWYAYNRLFVPSDAGDNNNPGAGSGAGNGSGSFINNSGAGGIIQNGGNEGGVANQNGLQNPANPVAASIPADANPASGHPQVIRAIAYPDTAEFIELATSTVSQLRQHGFPDARAVRTPRDKEGKRFEIVVLVGIGESARDPKLIAIGERLRAMPGFGAGQSKQRPFEDALIIRQPDSDRTGTGH